MTNRRFEADRRRLLPAAAAASIMRPATAQVFKATTMLPMIEKAIPSSGEMLPVIGLGTWNTFDVGDDPRARVRLAQVLKEQAVFGRTVVDTSPMYGSAEAVLGDLLKEVAAPWFIATKVWTRGRAEGVAQMQRSMRRLGVGKLDLLQVHNLVDVATHLRTLRDWQQQGLVRYVGITHYNRSAYSEIERLLKTEKLDFLQINYSLAEREAEERLLPLAQERGVAVIVNRPFAEGALFERVRGKPLPPALADEFRCDEWAQFFLKFIVSHPAVTVVIPATSSVVHASVNMGAGLGEPVPVAKRAEMAKVFAAI